MAFTKAPEYNTHQTIRLTPRMTLDVATPNVYIADYPDFALQNAYIIKEGEEAVVYGAPPYKTEDLSPAVSNGTSGPHSVYIPTKDNTLAWFVRDADLFSTTPSGASATLATAAFNSTNNLYEKGWTKYTVAGSQYHVAVDSGATTDSYIRYFTDFGVLSSTTTLTGIKLNPDIVFLDGYLFVATNSNNFAAPARIYNSTLGTPTTWNTSTDFIDAEMEGDYLLGLAKHHNHLVAFGRYTIEFFYNSGNELGSPLQRQANYAKNIGLIGNHITVGDTIYFIGVEDETVGFYRIQKFSVEKIKFPILDRYLNKSPFSFIGTSFSPFKLSTMLLEHGLAVVFPFVTSFYTVLVYLVDHQTFASFEYLYPEGLAGSIKCNTLGNGSFFLAANTTTGNCKVCRIIPSEDTTTLTWPGSIVFFQNEGFANDSQKHIKWVDVNGLFRGDNTERFITLSGIKGKEMYGASLTNFNTKTVNAVPNDAPFRWRNLGRSRYHTYMVQISGPGQFRLDNLEVAYNLGTY